ncbi:MAG: AMP-binding protein [Crocosphaera sp.]
MLINTEFEKNINNNQTAGERSMFFWTDAKLFDNCRQETLNILIALQQVLTRNASHLGSPEDIAEIEEFLDIYEKMRADSSEYFLPIWTDPYAYHWCQLAFDLVKSTLTKRPLPFVAQQYCQRIDKKTPFQGLMVHLNQFKLFAIAHAILWQQNYQFKTPFLASLPLAIPGTSLYLEGKGKIEIEGIQDNQLVILGKDLELSPNATLKEENLKVGQCPTLHLEDWKLRFQPYCFNSPEFLDGEAVTETGMAYQQEYVSLVENGLELIEQYHPQTFEQLPYFMEILALKPLDMGNFINLSSSDFPGALICSVIDNPYRLADNFIHEFHHNRLFLIEQNNPLLLDSLEEDKTNNNYYSPWRQDLRPLRGILHATYVYTPVAQFWLNVYQGGATRQLLDCSKSQLIRIPLQLQIGLEQLRKYAKFTDLGHQLFQELETQITNIKKEIAQLSLPLDVPAVNFQKNGSFVYSLREKTGQIVTTKTEIVNHIQRSDYFQQIETQLQEELGLDPHSDDHAIKEKPAIAYGERPTEQLEVIPTLAEILQQKIERCAEAVLKDLRGDQSRNRTYANLWPQATRILAYLQSQDLSPGDLIILYLEGCHDFVATVWACFLGGFVPVPVTQSKKLQQVWQTLDHPPILTRNNHEKALHSLLNHPQTLTLENSQPFSPSEHFYRNHPEDLALLLATSGTTGQPKLVSFDAVTVIGQFLTVNARTKDSQCFLSWIPFDNASGFRLITPQLGQTLYIPAESLFGNPLGWLDIVEQYQVTATVLTNFAMTCITQQVKQTSQPHRDLSSLKTIALGSEKIVPQTCYSFMQTLQPLGLRSDVFRIGYGLSETGLIASGNQWKTMGYSDRQEQFMEIGPPLPGCAIRIVNEENHLLNEGEVGEIQIRGTGVIRGYYNNPRLNSSIFTEDGWFKTGDLGFLRDNCLTVTGRQKEIIIINGKNYTCQEIELVVEAVQGVEPSYTLACPLETPDKDELVIVFHTQISQDEQLGHLAKQIRGQLTQRLGINPHHLIPVPKSAIPRTATGKIQRQSLKQRLEVGEFEEVIKKVNALIEQVSDYSYIAPRNDIEEQLAQILETLFAHQPIGIHDNFFDLGGDSILAARFLAQIETQWQKTLSLAALFEAPTIEKLGKILSEETWSSSWYSLVPIQPLGDKIPLFAIHLLGEGLSFYRPLGQYLGNRQPIYGLNYGLAARKGHDKPVNLPPIKELAAHYIKEMQQFQPQGPYILMGVSNGGNVAFEMAKQLQAEGETVSKLILFDTIHPNVKLPSNWKTMSTWQKLRLDVMRRMQIQWGNFWLLKPQERLSYCIDKLKHWSTPSTPPLVAQETIKHQNMNPPSAQSNPYIPEDYPGKITLFKAQHTKLTFLDPSNGWEGVASEGMETYVIHGAHSKILAEPSVRILSEKLTELLAEVPT